MKFSTKKFVDFRAGLYIFALILAVEALIRYKSILHPASVDWDEDGFVTTGKLLVRNGSLPFVSTFEQKPPLGALLYGIPFVFVEHAPSFVRFTAGFLLAVSVFLITSINSGRAPIYLRLSICILFITFVSVMPTGLGWMTEINSILVISIVAYAFWRWTLNKLHNFTLGVAIGVMPLVRTNLGIPAFLLLIYLFLLNREKIFNWLQVCVGALTVLIATITPYLLTGNVNQFWKGMVGVHIPNLSGSEGFHFEFGKKHFLILSVSIIFIVLAQRRILRESRISSKSEVGSAAQLFLNALVLLFIGTCVSIALDQPNFAHHLLQACPFPVAFMWLFLSMHEDRFSIKRTTSLFLVFALLLSCIYLVSRISEPTSNNFRYERQVQACVSKSIPRKSTLWSLNAIYLYWREDYVLASPLLIHPSTVLMPNFLKVMPDKPTNQDQAINLIFSAAPDYVIRSSGTSYLPSNLLIQLNEVLSSKYHADDSCLGVGMEIYRKKLA